MRARMISRGVRREPLPSPVNPITRPTNAPNPTIVRECISLAFDVAEFRKTDPDLFRFVPCVSRLICRIDKSHALETFQYAGCRFLRSFVLGKNHDLGMERWLVRIADSGEVFQFARQGLFVHALHVALDA